jgi:uncharacterized membrane protein
MRTNKGAVAGMLLALASTSPLRADERPKEEPRKPLRGPLFASSATRESMPSSGRTYRPMRALLFADSATRELEFLRAQLAREEGQKRAELSVWVQTSQVQADLNVPGHLGVKAPPTFPADLSAFDVIVAFDPDWSQLTAENTAGLKAWVEAGGGLILVAGRAHTFQLGRPQRSESLKPILQVLPVALGDSRLDEIDTDTPKPMRLTFRQGNALPLRLDEAGEGILAGWEMFFTGREAAEKGGKVLRGFHNYYPVRSVKEGAAVAAAYEAPAPRLQDGQAQPFLVAGKAGRGRVIYLSSGELWRLRAYRTAYYERLWASLLGHAAGR